MNLQVRRAFSHRIWKRAGRFWNRPALSAGAQVPDARNAVIKIKDLNAPVALDPPFVAIQTSAEEISRVIRNRRTQDACGGTHWASFPPDL
jgi:hypothetical protein